MIKVPFYNQNKNYTCGPAVLKMVFRFYGLKKKEVEIAQALSSESENGTSLKEIRKYSEGLGFSVYIKDGADLTEIEEFIDDNKPVIVNFKEPSNNEGHYAVVVGTDDKNVYLNDPWNGKDFKISKEEFIIRWHNDKVTRARTIVVLSPIKK